jgi:hypothetical protein
MSVIAVIGIQLDLVQNYSFSFTPDGFNTFLEAYSKKVNLFAGTIAITGLYFGLLRVNAAVTANVEKVKNDRFSEWKTVLDVRAAEIEKKDPFMKREFVKVRFQFFSKLYDKNFNISNKDALIDIFSVFKPIVPFFEQQNNEYINMGGTARNQNHSYSFDSFRFLFFGGLDNYYNNIETDLRNLYIENMPADRIVNEEMYHAAYKNHHRLM